MRITSSNVALSSSQINISSQNVYEHLRAWDNTSELTYSAQHTDNAATQTSLSIKDVATISPEAATAAKLATAAKSTTASSTSNTDSSSVIGEAFIGDLKAQIIKDIVEMMTGKKITVYNPADIDRGNAPASIPETVQPTESSDAAPRQPEGWGVDYYYKESNYTKEGIQFSAAGMVTTADGRSIAFTTSLEMSRETYQQVELSVKAGDALIDPLVLDLAGTGAGLSDVKFAFDLNADGIDEFISTPSAGTGFLAIDRNGNGVIDDGTELFGPQSGNGFSELSQLDDDHNGWIDENDAAFEHLRIWRKGADGTDLLTSLLDNDVGALYTGRAATNYTLTDTANRLAGMLRESGVYLRESGGAGTIQEVDLIA